MKKRILFDIALVLGVIVFNSLMRNIFPMSYFMPNVFLIVVIAFSLFEEDINILVVSLILGIFLDCTRGTSFGLSIMSFLVISYILSFHLKNINKKNFFISFLLVLFLSIVYNLITYADYLFIMKSDIVINEFILITAKFSLGNMALFIPVYILAYLKNREID